MLKESITLLLVVFSLSSFAQVQIPPSGKNNENNEELPLASVPKQVRSAFEKDHPGVRVTWEIENAQYEATYTENGQKNTVIYEESGDLFGTETRVKSEDMPTRIIHYISQHYKGSNPQFGKKITKANGEVNYYVKADNNKQIFDSDGKFIRSEKD